MPPDTEMKPQGLANCQEDLPLNQALTQLTDRLRGILTPAAGAAAVRFDAIDYAFGDAVDTVLGDSVETLSAEIEAARETISAQARRIAYLEHLSTTDELTGVFNRRGFEVELHRVLARAERYGEDGVLVYVDLDGFKPVNDTHGHQAGDEVLREVARILTDSVRDSDIVARLGGDEFAVLLVRTRHGDGLARVEALDARINGAAIEWNGRVIQLRASFGFQAFESGKDGQELLRQADAAMYEIKKFKEGEAERRQA